MLFHQHDKIVLALVSEHRGPRDENAPHTRYTHNNYDVNVSEYRIPGYSKYIAGNMLGREMTNHTQHLAGKNDIFLSGMPLRFGNTVLCLAPSLFFRT